MGKIIVNLSVIWSTRVPAWLAIERAMLADPIRWWSLRELIALAEYEGNIKTMENMIWALAKDGVLRSEGKLAKRLYRLADVYTVAGIVSYRNYS